MSLMQAPPSRPSRPAAVRARGAEPGGFTLFLLFFGSLILAGLIGIWLWNSNGSVREGRAFGTPNQLAQGGPATAPAGAGGPAAAGAAAAALDPALVSKGQQLANQFGCIACHTINGQASVGPTWKGLADSQVPLDNGQAVAADDAYLKESITDPDAKIVKGFSRGLMSATIKPREAEIQQGDNLDALVAYIKSLK
jgi:cytochrome c551/c552